MRLPIRCPEYQIPDSRGQSNHDKIQPSQILGLSLMTMLVLERVQVVIIPSVYDDVSAETDTTSQPSVVVCDPAPRILSGIDDENHNESKKVLRELPEE